MSLSCFESCIRLETERYLFFSNSDSRALICAAVKAVRGRFFRSSAEEPPEPPLMWAELESSEMA